MKTSFFSNSLMTLGRQILSIVIGLITPILIARCLGPEGQGAYALIILLPTMLVTFLNLGLNSSSVYYLGKKEIDLNSLYRTNVIVSLFLSGFAFSIGLIVVTFFSEQFFSQIARIYLLIMLGILPVLFLNSLLQAIFQGKQDFRAFNAILLVGQGLTMMLILLLLLIFNAGLNAALFSYAAGQMATFITIVYLMKDRFSVTFLKGSLSINYVRKSLSYGIKAHLSNVLTFLNYRADIFMVSFFINPAAVGLYVIAVNIAERLWIFSKSISTVLFPTISSLNNNEDKNRITVMISRNVLAISVIGGSIFYLLSDVFIHILFGAAYQDSSLALKFLLPGIILGSIERILSNDIAGRGKPEINLYTTVFTVALNIGMNIWLIPLYGINGAALATTITYAMAWTIKIVIFKKITNQSYRSILLVKKEDIRLYINLLNKFRPRTRGA